MAKALDIGTAETRLNAARELRTRAKLASAAVESFLRWSYLLQYEPETAVKAMRKAYSCGGKSYTDASPILTAGAEMGLAAVSARLVKEASERADVVERERRERAIREIANEAVRLALNELGHGLPLSAPMEARDKRWRIVRDAVDTAMGNPPQRDAHPDHVAKAERPKPEASGANVVSLFASPR